MEKPLPLLMRARSNTIDARGSGFLPGGSCQVSGASCARLQIARVEVKWKTGVGLPRPPRRPPRSNSARPQPSPLAKPVSKDSHTMTPLRARTFVYPVDFCVRLGTGDDWCLDRGGEFEARQAQGGPRQNEGRKIENHTIRRM